MKYIRTKDGVYELTGKPNAISITNNVLYYCWDENGENEIIIRDDEIIKKSDTIEELCDMFVDEETKTIFHKHNGYVINWKTNMVYSLKALSESYHSVKGAIYNDKGLIYVAKMNQDGELVLI